MKPEWLTIKKDGTKAVVTVCLSTEDEAQCLVDYIKLQIRVDKKVHLVMPDVKFVSERGVTGEI